MERPFDRIRQTLEELNSLVDEIEASEKENATSKCEELGFTPYRVVHLNDNPYSLALRKEQDQYEALVKENNRLKIRLSQLESGNDANETMRIDEAVNNHHQKQMLTQMVTEYRDRSKKIMESLKKTAWSFREACFLLTGYRVDKLKDDVYRLSLHEGGHDDESLYFSVKRDGSLNLIENNYSMKLTKLTSARLKGATHSYPALLAAIVLHSLESSSSNSTRLMNQTQAMDISMSTTILPNPSFLR